MRSALHQSFMDYDLQVGLRIPKLQYLIPFFQTVAQRKAFYSSFPCKNTK